MFMKTFDFCWYENMKYRSIDLFYRLNMYRKIFPLQTIFWPLKVEIESIERSESHCIALHYISKMYVIYVHNTTVRLSKRHTNQCVKCLFTSLNAFGAIKLCDAYRSIWKCKIWTLSVRREAKRAYAVYVCMYCHSDCEALFLKHYLLTC